MSAYDLSRKPGDLLEMVQRAALRPGRGLRFFRSGEEVEFLSYGQLYEDATRIAGALLTQANVHPLERIAVVLPTSADCVRALWGVLAAGAVPVPLPPPIPFNKPRRYAERIRGAIQRSGIRLIIGDERLEPLLRQMGVELGDGVTILSAPQLRGDLAAFYAQDPDAPALVQHTSGSTGQPKGVVLTHRQVLANLEAIVTGLDLGDDEVTCSWLPLVHDLGLIGCLFASVYRGADLLLMPPEDFALDPLHWLKLFGRYRVSISAAPNAAYLHCVRRISAKTAAMLDLSSWSAAMSGAEDVDPETMRLFSAHFASAGFRPRALMPVYGMAEATSAVSFSPRGQGMQTLKVRRSALGQGRVELAGSSKRDCKELASVGSAVLGMELALRDSFGNELPEDVIGEIFISGPSVMERYDRDDVATRRALQNHWLATGDLGFRHDGRLYVSGSHQEMIAVRGQTFYAADLERLAAQVIGVGIDGVMALGISHEGTESLVLLIENRQTDAESQRRIKLEVREALSGTLGIVPDAIVLLGRGGLPRTASGKLERHKGPELCAQHLARDETVECAPLITPLATSRFEHDLLA